MLNPDLDSSWAGNNFEPDSEVFVRADSPERALRFFGQGDDAPVRLDRVDDDGVNVYAVTTTRPISR